jgi:Fe(3+) dicitrate transport protein
MPKLRLLHTIFFLITISVQAQYALKGIVVDAESSDPIPYAHIKINEENGVVSDSEGRFEISNLNKGAYSLEVSFVGYKDYKQDLNLKRKVLHINVALESDVMQLSQVELVEQHARQTNITRLRSVEGTAIYASKKNEVILMDQSMANKATNNSRQVYSKVPGLNIWESDGLGMQLEIGARGLSPHRTSNFNTRQNGYDISADALGYPESYYTPPSEAIQKIEIVRGAASLQYGTQFGGLLNFVLKKGADKPIELVARQSMGSFNLQNTYVSLGGKKGKWSYYSFYQRKSREGWRPNSSIEAQSAYLSTYYQPNDKFKIGLELTHMDYLAQQPGGLTDMQFEDDPSQSNRARNWFKVDWNIAALNVDYKFDSRTELNSRTFGLWASREALGVLYRIDWEDQGYNRDLLTSRFNNLGNETRIIHRYLLGDKSSVLLLGGRLYKGLTHKAQGQADAGSNANFTFENKLEAYGTDFEFPSLNKSVFAENLIRINDCLSVTPGLRYDHIITQSDGYFHAVVNDSLHYSYDTKRLERGVFLAGLGASYQCFVGGELYANFSQNYRAINFNDMQVINANIVIDPDLEDEKGFNIDLGLRGRLWNRFEFDMSLFYLNYSNRIGYLLKYYTPEQASESDYIIAHTTYRFSTNVGDSKTAGLETYMGYNVLSSALEKQGKKLNLFVNVSAQHGVYVRSEEAQIEGNQVELNPNLNFKIGTQFQYKNITSSLLYSHTGSQFSDAQNTVFPSTHALFGEIPAYSVVDFSTKYEKGKFVLEAGVNNLLNESYFTRRATGYPGPGIIPSDKRNFYLSLQVKL